MRPWIYIPFKGHKESLEGYKLNWNHTQISTRMCVEHAFGIVKRRWRIIIRRANVLLQHIGDIVATCILLI